MLARISRLLFPPETPELTLSAALLHVCFFGFMRAGEIAVPSQSGYDPGVHMNFGDISVDSVANPIQPAYS